jgi:hypothetical protein
MGGGEMDYALVFRWARPVAGREAKALEVLAEVRTYFGELFADGKVEEPLLLTHWNDGMMIVRGDMSFLFEIMSSDEFDVLLDKAMYIAEGFRRDGYWMGEATDHRFGLFAEAGKALAYI